MVVNNPHGSFDVGLYHTLARTRQQQWPKGNTVAPFHHKWWPNNKNMYIGPDRRRGARLGDLKYSVWW